MKSWGREGRSKRSPSVLMLITCSNWGNSLSYLNAAGTAGAPSPRVLANTQIASNKEFSIFTDKKCNGDCGYYREGTVAYRRSHPISPCNAIP
jgi:hypothetical protein